MICLRPSKHAQPPQCSSSAFTLLELLVTVAVIGVLAAILLGATTSTRRQAETAKCMSQLRSIGNAMFAYAAENNGVLPQGFLGAYPNPKGSNWFEYLAPYVGLSAESVIGYNAMKCPAKSGFKLDYSMYGANYPSIIGLNPGQTGSSWMEPGARRLNGTAPARAFMIADAQGGFVYTPTLWPLSGDYDKDGTPDSNHMPYAGLDFRHNHKANFFLVDGSMRQLTTKQWGKNDGNIWGVENR